MAEPSPLAGLLDRASHIFSLAAQLGRAFQKEHEAQRRAHRIDPSAWGRLRSGYDDFSAAVLELKDAMQKPPAGFAPVAEALLEAARLARQIRAATQNPECFAQATYLDFFLHFNSLAAAGERTIRAAIKAQRLDDPFAFLDQPVSPAADGIDTMPSTPKPPALLIDAAGRHIPDILSNVQPAGSEAVELTAVTLVAQLQNAGHTLAAAHWAIHEAVQAGRLRAGRVVVELPGIGVPGSSWDGPAYHWRGGGRGTKAIPKGKPAPFDCFKVVATEALWEWWRSLEVTDPREDAIPADAPGEQGEPAPTGAPAPRPKRSTGHGEGRAKLISALTKHHRYAEGGALVDVPINNNALARLAAVDKATASIFFKKEFGGHEKYVQMCREVVRLAASLKHLNGEYTPQTLFGGQLADTQPDDNSE